jgi:glycosyltransferase involved in cell wall biosynthesis
MFDIPFNEVFNQFKKEFKNHAEIEIIDTFIPDIETLYNACEGVFTMTHAECFWLPGLEAFAANKLVISPRYGGQLDYLNDDNSILIDGKLIRADTRMQYWEPSPYAAVFDPDINQAAEKLKDVYHNYGDYMKKFSPLMQEIIPNYSWTKVAQQFVDLAK